MVEMGMGVENMGDRQPKLLHFVENSIVCSSGIDNDGLLRHRIADDRAIAAKGRDGKCFSNHGRHDERMLPS